MHIYLHIGLHKTGTTAIQQFLKLNTAALEATGYYYPTTGRDNIAHHTLGSCLWPDQKRGDYWPKLKAELEKSTCGNAVISTESLEYLREESQFKYLAEQLQGHTVTIIIYLRRQDHFLVSSYAQDVKARGFTCDIKQYYKQTLARYDYSILLNRWAKYFGQENISVRVYENEQLPNGLIVDFLDTLGIGWKNSFKELKKRPNPSLNDYGVLIMQVANELINDIDLRNSLCRKIIEITDTAPKRSYSILPPSLREEILSAYANSNATVAKEFLGRTDGRLFVAPIPNETNSDDTDLDATYLISIILKVFIDQPPVNLSPEIVSTKFASIRKFMRSFHQ